ncbi:MAG: EamA family transporter [Candidatus Micrarchaeia archaeon]
MLEEGIYLSVFIALSWSLSGIIVKWFSSKHGNAIAALAIALGNLMIIGAAAAVIGNFSISANNIMFSLLAGITNGIGYMLFFFSLSRQQASNTYATIEIQVALIVAYSVAFLGERLSALAVAGGVLILFGILAVSVEKKKFNKALVPAIAANVFWALGWILLINPISSTKNVLLPIWISFTAAAAIILVAMLRSTSSHKSARKVTAKDALGGLSAGLLSGLGNALYGVVIVIKELAIGTLLSNGSPAIIAILAHFIYHDKLTKPQVIGIIAIVVGGLLIGI